MHCDSIKERKHQRKTYKDDRILARLSIQRSELFNIDLIDKYGTITTRHEGIFSTRVEDISLIESLGTLLW